MSFVDTRLTPRNGLVGPRIAVVGGDDQEQHGVRQRCAEVGLVLAASGDMRIVIDGPVGSALALLQRPSGLPTVVWTTNANLAYCADLWDLHPTVLLTSATPDLMTAVCAAAAGDGYCEPPIDQMPLTSGERRILQRVAVGLSNTEIANALGMREQTVANNLSRIFMKLKLPSRNAAALYYWGIQTESLIDLLR